MNLKKIKSWVPKLNSELSNSATSEKLLIDNKLSLIIEQLVQENRSLSSRLAVVTNELNEKSESIEKIKRLKNISPFDMIDDKVHFAFLFASPLTRVVNGIAKTSPQLDWIYEIEDIMRVLKHLNYELRYKVCVATWGNKDLFI